MLGLRFCAKSFSSCGKWGLLFITVHGPLPIVTSLVVEHRLQTCRLNSCGSRTQLPHGMCNLPRPGLKPMPPALAGRLSTIAPPGKPQFHSFECIYSVFPTPLIEQAFSDREFKVTMINTLRALVEKWDNVQEQMGNVSREMEPLENIKKKC